MAEEAIEYHIPERLPLQCLIMHPKWTPEKRKEYQRGPLSFADVTTNQGQTTTGRFYSFLSQENPTATSFRFYEQGSTIL